jgi:hypothetical protein
MNLTVLVTNFSDARIKRAARRRFVERTCVLLEVEATS